MYVAHGGFFEFHVGWPERRLIGWLIYTCLLNDTHVTGVYNLIQHIHVRPKTIGFDSGKMGTRFGKGDSDPGAHQFSVAMLKLKGGVSTTLILAIKTYK